MIVDKNLSTGETSNFNSEEEKANCTPTIYEESLTFHEKHRGKISVELKAPLNSRKDLSLAYTPGVAQPCLEIQKNKSHAYDYTIKGNFVAVITDGSAVLGLGNIGPEAAMPVMEGKAALFKKFGDIDAIALCVATQDVDEFVNTVALIAPSFGGINLEDISAPRCFEIENKLKARVDIPVFHDDQHGTAVVVLAALINALELADKNFPQVSAVISGAGAAGVAIAELLMAYGIGNVILCDTKGAIYKGRPENMPPYKVELAEKTNKLQAKGSLKEVLKGADIFIGVSQPNLVDEQMVRSMADKAIVMGLSNPEPEVVPKVAKAGGAFIVCTGRSDYPNQVNNALAFPGIFRGALDVRASEINTEMQIAAARAIANAVTREYMNPDFIVPSLFESELTHDVAEAVAKAALDTGVARR